MQTDFGFGQKLDDGEIVTFADEIKPNYPKSHWAYVGIIGVRKESLRTALDNLVSDRQSVKHQGAMHFTNISGNPGKPSELAKKWLARIMWEPEIWSFGIVGLNMELAVREAFGTGKGNQDSNAYRRHYRALLTYMIGMWKPRYHNVRITKCYHDSEGRLMQCPYFNESLLAKVEDRTGINIGPSRFCFVDKHNPKNDHEAKATQFLQLCDIMLGTTRYIFEKHTECEARDVIAEDFFPIVERLNDPKRANNKNSRYRTLGRSSLSSWPSKQLEATDLDNVFRRAQSSYYLGRPTMFTTSAQRKQGEATRRLF